MSDRSPKKAAEPPSAASERRSFLARLGVVGIGAILALFPFAAGLGTLLHPLLRRRGAADVPVGGQAPGAAADPGAADSATLVRICPLDALPQDGIPRPFAVTTDVIDAWTRAQNQRIGLVFLSRDDTAGEPQITALSATCPHLGCAVDFSAADDHYECPCHVSAFAKDGAKLFGPSLRGLDPLEVRLVEAGGQTEVWIAFQKFHTGLAERIPVG